MKQDTRTAARLEARLPQAVLARLKRAAEIQGRTLTDFVVAAADDAACRTIEQTEIIRLSLEDQRRIAAAILRPSAPTAAWPPFRFEILGEGRRGQHRPGGRLSHALRGQCSARGSASRAHQAPAAPPDRTGCSHRTPGRRQGFFQRRGLGGALVMNAVDRTLHTDIATFMLLVDANNDRAAAFCQRCGFRPFRTRPRTLFLPLATAKKALLGTAAP